MSKQPVIVIGAGGHGKVVADALICNDIPVLGFLDDASHLHGTQQFGLDVLGGLEACSAYPNTSLVVAIGNNTIRSTIVAQLMRQSPKMWQTTIHPKAIISDTASIGEGSQIVAGAIINADTIIGQHTIINTGTTVDHDCNIADFVHIAPGVNLGGGVEIGSGSLIGIGSTVLPYTQIGRDVTIGAGAVVTSNVPNGVTAVGVPAKWKLL